MGQTTKKSTSTQTTTPAASGDLRFALDNNRDLFDLLSGREAPDFSLTNPFSAESEAALTGIADRAQAGNPLLDQAQGAVGDIVTGGPFGGATDFLTDVASGGVQNEAADFLRDTASGNFFTGLADNPVYQQALEELNSSVGSIFERAGRTGSGANQSAIARGAGSLAAGVFNQERSNQLNAAQALANVNAQDRAAALNANSLLNAGASTRLSAAGLSPQLANADFADLQALLGAGQVRDAQAQRELDEDIFRYNFPFENAIQANDILTRNTGGLAAVMGGTTTGEATERTNPGLFNQILGAALTAGSFFG